MTPDNYDVIGKLKEFQLADVTRWLCVALLAFTLSACSSEEEPLTDNQTPPGGSNPPGSPPPPPPPGSPPPPAPPPPSATDEQIFAATLHVQLTEQANFCVSCHGVSQDPTFSVADVSVAYNAIVTQQKVNLMNPPLSRVYQRVKDDRHNCGGDASCDRIADDFLAAIQDWANQTMSGGTPPGGGTPVTSLATNFANATAGGAARVDGNAIALFTFTEGAGDITVDSSGVGNPITLQITGMDWIEGGGLRNVSGKAQASVEDSAKLYNMISASGEFTYEAWISPGLDDQSGPTRIISYSLNEQGAGRNAEMDQEGIYYRFRNRSVNEPNAGGAFDSINNPIQTVLQHLVMTFDPATGRKTYLDGELILEENVADTLAWVENSIFVLGNTPSDNRLWVGDIRMVAVHDRALNAAEIQQNYAAGTGNIVTMRFDVSGVIGQDAFVDMQVAQIDDAGYLFAKPTFVTDATGVAVKNLRVGVNGGVPVASQPFRRIDTIVDQTGTELSPLGGVVPSQLGVDQDMFHLEFEVLGAQVGLAELVAPSSPPVPVPDVPEPELGLRTFAQVNDTMASLTGIDPNLNAVLSSYSELRGSLPPSSDILSFASAQQIAIQRLATSYCGAIVSNAGRCSDFFGACAVDGGAKDQVGNTLYDRFIGDNLANQPARAGVTTEIVSVIDDLGCAGGCTGADAETVLQASCSAVLSSAAVTVN
ncbi:MAG: LamG domain-containing protein [Pseudomonadota bacterium]